MNETTKQNKDYWIALYSLFNFFDIRDKEINDLWSAFENEIKYENRFFPKNFEKIYHLFEECNLYTEYMLDSDNFLYRARTINSYELPELSKRILKFSNDFSCPEYFPRLISLILKDKTTATVKEVFTPEEIQLMNMATQDRYWGYDAKNSDAPPTLKAYAGRANPKGVSFLYTSEDENTAISEMRPVMGQMISVATIRIKRSLRLFDFTASIPDHDGMLANKAIILYVIARRMSMPNFEGEINYFPTQYVCEMLKNRFSYDGIRFKSSLNSQGNNVVLFDTFDGTGDNENYHVINSSLHTIESVSVITDRKLPLEALEEIEKNQL